MFPLATGFSGFLVFVLLLVFLIDLAATSCIGDGGACFDDASDKEIAFLQRQASRKKIERDTSATTEGLVQVMPVETSMSSTHHNDQTWGAKNCARNQGKCSCAGPPDAGCCHTQARGESNWWKADLGKEYMVAKLLVSGRKGYINDQTFASIKVSVDEPTSMAVGVLCADEDRYGDKEDVEKLCKHGPIRGRWVMVGQQRSAGTRFMSMCDMKIFVQAGEPTNAACSTITCTDTHVQDMSASNLLCAGETCDPSGADNDYCCNPKALCSTIQCGSANIVDLAAATETCENEACVNTAGSVDLEKCCNPKALCSTITCVEGTIADSTADTELCEGATCNNAAADNEVCCNARAACSTIICANTHEQDTGAVASLCVGASCDNTGSDNELCCNIKACYGTADLQKLTIGDETGTWTSVAGTLYFVPGCGSCGIEWCGGRTIDKVLPLSCKPVDDKLNHRLPCSQAPCVGASCIIWGDPHVMSFDLQQHLAKQHPLREEFFRVHDWKANQQQVYEHGTFWLVRSRRVHIQGEYKASILNSSQTNLYTLAISGSFLNNNTLIIRPKESAITWNGHEILETIGTSFADEAGLVSAKYHRDSKTVQDGSWSPGVDINLPMGVKLTVNRWKDNLNAEIKMCKQEGGQDGQCGNFNGDHMDDAIDGSNVS